MAKETRGDRAEPTREKTAMNNRFFEQPILNSPYGYPDRHWELDDEGQPTQKIIETRRRAKYIVPIPKPKKRRKSDKQQEMVFDEGKGISTQEQQYDPTPIINELRQYVDEWRKHPNPNQWQVTPFPERSSRITRMADPCSGWS